MVAPILWCNMKTNELNKIENSEYLSLQIDTICDNFSLEELSEIYKMKQILKVSSMLLRF